MSSQNWDIKINIDSGDWSLFLDRDGVINRRLVDDYVKSWGEFEFLPGVLDAISIFSQKFKHIFVVTNQQGIGKGLMSKSDLKEIHNKMLQQIESNNGRVDAVYFCPSLAADNDPMRKPNPGMAFNAKEDFPEVDFQKSLMVGDSISDMEFGNNAGMRCVFIGKQPKHLHVDGVFPSLIDLAKAIY